MHRDDAHLVGLVLDHDRRKSIPQMNDLGHLLEKLPLALVEVQREGRIAGQDHELR